VLTSARSLFGRNGYAQTSLDEIAATARVTKGAVYHHFASKKALFRAVYAEVEADAQAHTVAAADPKGSAVDQVVAGVNAYLDVAMDKEIQQITLLDGPAVLGLEPEGPADQQPGHVALRAFIATARADSQIIDLEPDVLAHLIGGLALMGGLVIARADDPEATRAAVGHALEAMLRGLAPVKRR
jgi:AcrR family transcriptional regulator